MQRNTADPFQQRKRVFAALREILCRLTARYPLICVIEDMQWADTDSLVLLEELLRAPDAPRMLLLASLLSIDAAPSLPRLPGEVRLIHLERLNSMESISLADALLDSIAPERKPESVSIATRTAGHPLWIDELVRYAAADSQAAIGQPHLDEAIWARVSQLDEAALNVLKILAVAVEPFSEELICTATRLGARVIEKSLAILRAGHLIRSSTSSHASFEVYHDRVRQSVLLHLDDEERVQLHQRCASALEASNAEIQPELVIYHLEGARRFDEAAHNALEAANRAQLRRALEQAAWLSETALRLAHRSEDEKRAVYARLKLLDSEMGLAKPVSIDAQAIYEDGKPENRIIGRLHYPMVYALSVGGLAGAAGAILRRMEVYSDFTGYLLLLAAICLLFGIATTIVYIIEYWRADGCTHSESFFDLARGIAAVVDIGATLQPLSDETEISSDLEAIGGDWEVVGRSLREQSLMNRAPNEDQRA